MEHGYSGGNAILLSCSTHDLYDGEMAYSFVSFSLDLCVCAICQTGFKRGILTSRYLVNDRFPQYNAPYLASLNLLYSVAAVTCGRSNSDFSIIKRLYFVKPNASFS